MIADRRKRALLPGLVAAACGLLSALPGWAQASDYPKRPVTVILPYPAGGIADSVTRMVTERLRQRLDQPFIVENKPGASGSIGTAAAFRAAPDGYTLLSTPSSPIIVNQFIQKNLAYNPSELKPVAWIGATPLVLSVRADLPAKTVQDFVLYAKANAGKLNYASNGVGGSAHLATLLFSDATGITGMTHIPYSGNAPILQALVSGQVDLFWDNLGSALPLHQAGKLRILAVGSKERAPSLPDVPTLEEVGYRDLIIHTWFAVFAPPKTPDAIVEKLAGEIQAIVQGDDVKSRFQSLGINVVSQSAADMAKAIDADRQRWGAAIKGANIPLQ